MPRARKRSSPLAIDTVPLPEKVVRGKLEKVGEGYLLRVGTRRMALSVGTLVDPTAVKKLAGKAVAVAFSATKPKTVVAIGAWPPPRGPLGPGVCYWWLCYIPAPEILRPIEPFIRRLYADEVIRIRGVSAPLIENSFDQRLLTP